MSFPVDEKLPRTYFLDIMNAQVMMAKTYLDDLDSPLIFSPYCGNMMASFRFYPDTTDDAYPLLHYTFSNLGDLQDQLYYFWLQHIYLLKKTYIAIIYVSL